nr:lytic transglycosylase domain-containing protein [Dyella psychrodurans]
MELLTCPNLAVPVEIMHHVVDVESGYNPYAIGVVNGQLVRQPQSLDEALATVKMLESNGYNFSVGVAQINHDNLVRYGLESYEKAFNPCLNLSVGSRILAECYESARADWGKAFSCYYSGNFVTGFRDGYVQKVYESIGQSLQIANSTSVPAAIPLRQTPERTLVHGEPISVPIAEADSAAYRIAMRSVALDTVASVAAVKLNPTIITVASDPSSAQAAATPSKTVAPSAPASTARNDGVFVPQVRGPSDPSPGSASPARNAQTNAMTVPVNQPPGSDPADLRQGGSDGAFVF